MINMKRTGKLIAWITVALFLATLATPAQSADDDWQFTITPYLWTPSIDGSLKYDFSRGASPSPSVSVGASDYLKNLKFTAMISGEIRKDKWSLFTDVIYVDFGSEDSVVTAVDFALTRRNPVSSVLDIGTKSSLEGWTWTLAGSYRAFQSESGTFDVLVGFRYLSLSAKTHWRLSATIYGPRGSTPFSKSGTISQSRDLLDGIVGIRGRVQLGDSNWSMPYYLDVGTGSADLTWQGVLGIDYSFSAGDLRIGYRHLDYDAGGDKLIQDLRLSGPMIGFAFKF